MHKLKKILFYGAIFFTSFKYVPQIFLIIILLISIIESLIRKKKLKLDRFYVGLMLGMVILTLFSVMLGYRGYIDYSSYKRFLIVLLLPSLGAYYYIFSDDNFLKDYYDFTYFTALIGIVQIIAGLFNLSIFYDYRSLGFQISNIDFIGRFLRVYSIFREPSFLAVYYLPVIYLIVNKLITKKNIIKTNLFKNFGILTVYFMTFSTVAYVNFLIIALYIILIKKSQKKLQMLFFFILTILFGILIYLKVPTVGFKINNLFINKNIYSSATVFSFYSNYKIVLESLKETFLLGYGFQGYSVLYDKYIHLLFEKLYMGLKLNQNDGANMLFRILGEYGLIGGILFYLGLTLRYLKYKHRDVCNLFLICTVLYGIRSGIYSDPIFYIYLINFLKVTRGKKCKKKFY